MCETIDSRNRKELVFASGATVIATVFLSTICLLIYTRAFAAGASLDALDGTLREIMGGAVKIASTLCAAGCLLGALWNLAKITLPFFSLTDQETAKAIKWMKRCIIAAAVFGGLRAILGWAMSIGKNAGASLGGDTGTFNF